MYDVITLQWASGLKFLKQQILLLSLSAYIHYFKILQDLLPLGQVSNQLTVQMKQAAMLSLKVFICHYGTIFSKMLHLNILRALNEFFHSFFSFILLY